MDGHQYEYECAKMLRNKGFSNVTVTKGSGDQGIDITAYKGGKKYGIQCKYYSSPVGNHAVQEAFAGVRYYNCDVAVVMTNNTFTPAARELAKKTGVLLWGNNKVLVSSSETSFLKVTGNLGICSGIVWLMLMLITGSNKWVILQIIKCITLILGGFFCILLNKGIKADEKIDENMKWNMERGACMLSFILYSISALISIVYSVFQKGFYKSMIYFVFLASIPMFRTLYLRFKIKKDWKLEDK